MSTPNNLHYPTHHTKTINGKKILVKEQKNPQENEIKDKL
jgi:hypothetical protein